MFDLVIRGGDVIDGTGTAPFRADVGVVDGRIAAVAPSLDGQAPQVVDATGMVVTPGFVDVHTHYDGQATWDEVLEPSSAHGVTTIAMGNCGVGFAPVRPGNEEWLVRLMEGVEDIPARRSTRASRGRGSRSPSTLICSIDSGGRWTSPPSSPTAPYAAT